MKTPIPAPRATIGAHRLWTTLWTGLGQLAENLSRPGGNPLATADAAAAFHSATTTAGRPATGPVDGHSRPHLGGRQVSPGSTDPMTTTFIYFIKRPSTKQARRLAKLAACPLPCTTARTGGSFL